MTNRQQQQQQIFPPSIAIDYNRWKSGHSDAKIYGNLKQLHVLKSYLPQLLFTFVYPYNLGLKKQPLQVACFIIISKYKSLKIMCLILFTAPEINSFCAQTI